MQKKDQEIMEKYSIARTKYGAAVNTFDKLFELFGTLKQDTFTKREILLILIQCLLSLSKANKKILISVEKKNLKEVNATLKELIKK